MNRMTGTFFRSFQFRLLVYLLIVGSVPLFFSFYVFYQQSSQLSDQSISRNVRSEHELMLGRIKREMTEMDSIARQVAADAELNRLLRETDMRSEAIAARLSELTGGESLTPLFTVCVNTERFRSAACDLLQPADPEQRLPTGYEKRFQLIPLDPDHWVKQFGILLHYPVVEPFTKAVNEQVIVLYNVSKLLQEFDSAGGPILRQTLSEEDDISFTHDARKETGRNDIVESDNARYPLVLSDRIVDQLPLTLDNYEFEWTYRLEVENEYMIGARRSLKTTVLVLIALLVVLSCISSFVFTRFFTRSIHHLRSLMKRAEIGDLKAYWTSRGPGEINDLGESYNQMLFRIDELFRQVKLEEALKKEKEIEALQYQLNPHFLYNTLNTIKWVAKIHKTPQISEVVSSLVRLLQASLGKKGDFITVKEEVKLIQDYMEIQAFRYGEQVKMHYEVDPVASLCLVPRMIMQPLVENALIHGIEPSGREGAITIKAWIERDLLFCQVEDNGIGMSESELESGGAAQSKTIKEKLSGIGLNHIRQKIKLYYGSDYKMHVFSRRGEGTTIRLSLPIHRKEEEWTDEPAHRG